MPTEGAWERPRPRSIWGRRSRPTTARSCSSTSIPRPTPRPAGVFQPEERGQRYDVLLGADPARPCGRRRFPTCVVPSGRDLVGAEIELVEQTPGSASCVTRWTGSATIRLRLRRLSAVYRLPDGQRLSGGLGLVPLQRILALAGVQSLMETWTACAARQPEPRVGDPAHHVRRRTNLARTVSDDSGSTSESSSTTRHPAKRAAREAPSFGKPVLPTTSIPGREAYLALGRELLKRRGGRDPEQALGRGSRRF